MVSPHRQVCRFGFDYARTARIFRLLTLTILNQFLSGLRWPGLAGQRLLGSPRISVLMRQRAGFIRFAGFVRRAACR